MNSTSVQPKGVKSSSSHASARQSQLARRIRQVSRLLGDEGLAGVSDRVRRAAAERLTPVRTPSPVRHSDVIAADLANPCRPVHLPVESGKPLFANWVITPPSPGSGGHTTIFRMLRYLEEHGYRNRVYFYDAYGGDPAYYQSVVRNYYGFHGPIGDVNQGMEDAHLVFATGWPTAYPVFNSTSAGKRFYFIQDFEPYFYPVGTSSSLAESTYRMGFHGVTIGSCYAERIRNAYGMTVESFPYGCDVSKYARAPEAKRSGIVFYARRDNARRGFELGLMTLELFASRRPEIEIHVYGDKIGKQPFAFRDHGRVTPEQLNALYNRCFAGLSLSFTNVSLVALEMLAAGCLAVVNDTPEVRTDLRSSPVLYAAPLPQSLCAQLEAAIDRPDFDEASAAAASSVHSTTWDEAGVTFDKILRQALSSPDEVFLSV